MIKYANESRKVDPQQEILLHRCKHKILGCARIIFTKMVGINTRMSRGAYAPSQV
jgi:hypothetical protein